MSHLQSADNAKEYNSLSSNTESCSRAPLSYDYLNDAEIGAGNGVDITNMWPCQSTCEYSKEECRLVKHRCQEWHSRTEACFYDPLAMQNLTARENRTQVMEKTHITAHIIDSKNRPTDESIQIDVKDIISCPCQGNCGYSKAECYLVKRCCQDWYCPMQYRYHTGCPDGMFRIRKDITPGPCSNCGAKLIRSSE